MTISLHDANNSLCLGLNFDFCRTYNAVIWADRNFGENKIEITIFVGFCGKNLPPESITVDFCDACLCEPGDADRNKYHEQTCITDLNFIEQWKLRKKSLCLDGVVLDNALKNKLRPIGYIANRVEHGSIDLDCADLFFSNEDLIYYVWCGLHVGSGTEIFHYSQPEQAGDDNEINGLKISAVFSHHVTPDGSRVLSDGLCVFVADKEHPNAGQNSVSRVSYESCMDGVVWDQTLTNLLIHFESNEIKDVLEQQFIDIPVKYHDRKILLRLIFNPNWNILFIAIQNKLQGG